MDFEYIIFFETGACLGKRGLKLVGQFKQLQLHKNRSFLLRIFLVNKRNLQNNYFSCIVYKNIKLSSFLYNSD